MRSLINVSSILILAALVIAVGIGCTQTGERDVSSHAEIALPPPSLVGKVSVEAALAKRRSVRSFAQQDLTLQQTGQLAWAAQGITDASGGRRTSPSAGAIYPMKVYLVKHDGVFEYVPDGHKLRRLFGDDRRADLNSQPSVRQAPLDIVITGDYAKTRAKYDERAERYVIIEAGHIGQNIHLQAVALGLGSVSVGAFNDGVVTEVLALPSRETPLYIIPVGYPSGT